MLVLSTATVTSVKSQKTTANLFITSKARHSYDLRLLISEREKGFLTTITQSLVIVPSHGTLLSKHLAKAMTMVVRLFDAGDVSSNVGAEVVHLTASPFCPLLQVT